MTTGAWRVVLPKNLWNMSNKPKYELKIKIKIFNPSKKARQGPQDSPGTQIWKPIRANLQCQEGKCRMGFNFK